MPTELVFKNKKKISFDVRQRESMRMMSKYPDRIPCIVETCDDISLDKQKYLVPGDLTIGQLIFVIRKRVHLPQTDALFMFTAQNILPPTSALVSNVYRNFKDADGFLYFKISKENVFGYLQK
jgi:GABA(A) receptor-associated protein